MQKPKEKQLTLEDDLKVQYCIPEWLKIEQVKVNTETVKGRLGTTYDKRLDAIAVVSFGPSLNQTWEQIRNFKYVMTCSGAHRFLIDNGIVPNWHLAVDPLAKNTVDLIGQPHKDVEYLIASTCNPDVFEHLKDYNIKLWHIFDTSEEGFRILPQNEWAITGGCSVGARTLTLARFLGFTDIHVFGLDGCYSDKGSHAGKHPVFKTASSFTLDYDGKQYRTTPSMLAVAKGINHERDMLHDAEFTFHGEGLIQALAKNYARKERKQAFIGFSKPELISANYVDLNRQLHKSNLAYGVGGAKHAKTILDLMAASPELKSVLDYGCGKGYLAKELPFPIWEYDPAIHGKTDSPKPADLVICTDVLEHIEPELLMFVLDDLRRCVKQIGYFTIYTKAAQKTLPDGRNTHLIQKPREWWEIKLKKFFNIGKIITVGPELHVIVSPIVDAKKILTGNKVFRAAA